LILGILFVFLTSPIAGHLNGRAAYRSGVPMWGKSVRDDLGKALDKGRQAAKERGEAE
jgi:multicomponent Na+:H+ antiporter subunit G